MRLSNLLQESTLPIGFTDPDVEGPNVPHTLWEVYKTDSAWYGVYSLKYSKSESAYWGLIKWVPQEGFGGRKCMDLTHGLVDAMGVEEFYMKKLWQRIKDGNDNLHWSTKERAFVFDTPIESEELFESIQRDGLEEMPMDPILIPYPGRSDVTVYRKWVYKNRFIYVWNYNDNKHMDWKYYIWSVRPDEGFGGRLMTDESRLAFRSDMATNSDKSLEDALEKMIARIDRLGRR